MNVLIACEESQRICIEMRAVGNVCYSADLQECSGGHPEWHINGDCLPLINGNCEFTTQDGNKHRIEGRWDMIIAHPPCTYLCMSGQRWCNPLISGTKKAEQRKRNREEAVEFFMKFVNADCEKIAIENPVGIMTSRYRKADQYIEPFMFGHPNRKKTGLWLKGLPKLVPTNIVEPQVHISSSGKKWDIWFWESSLIPNRAERSKFRSKTFHGIARAIAEQWGKEEILKYKDPLPRKFW